MALPTGTDYADTTLPNPASDQSDTVVVVDLSAMPADWWTAVDTSDGARGRASKDDGVEEAATELAAEWYEFDDVNETGYVFVLWSGTNSATATETLRIYPPNTGNSSYAASATFGSEAVWVDWQAIWHDGGKNDSTANANNGVDGGGITPNGATGKIGSATNFDGSDDYFDHSSNNIGGLRFTDISILVWFKSNVATAADDMYIFYQQQSGSDSIIFNPTDDAGNEDTVRWRTKTQSHVGNNNYTTTDIVDQTWHHLAVTRESATGEKKGYTDTVDELTATGETGQLDHVQDCWVGDYPGNTEQVDGILDEHWIAEKVLPQDWITYQHDNTDSPSTFWGAWTWQGSGGGSISGTPNEMAVAVSLDQFAGVKTAVGTPNELSVATSLDQFSGVKTAVGSPNEMSVATSIDAFAGVKTAVGTLNDMLSSTTLDSFSGVKTAVGTPAGMNVSTSLDAFAGVLNAVGSPNEMSVATALDEMLTNIIGTPSPMSVATSLDQLTGTVTFVGSLDEMSVATQLEQTGGTITAVGTLDDMSVAVALEQVVGGTVGSATSVDLSANELYVVDLSTNKLYRITLSEEKLYNITLSDNEVID